jgi:hypothetical protein
MGSSSAQTNKSKLGRDLSHTAGNLHCERQDLHVQPPAHAFLLQLLSEKQPPPAKGLRGDGELQHTTVNNMGYSLSVVGGNRYRPCYDEHAVQPSVREPHTCIQKRQPLQTLHC